jgi:endonuclease/exonuclease/phosphatase family metal-dependent hydrolase
MKVVTWNTHHGGVNSAGKLNVAAISGWLVQFAPDVVSLNELEQNDSYGETDQLETHRLTLENAQHRPWYSAWCALNGSSVNKGIGVGLLSAFPMQAMDHFSYLGRPALYVSQPWGGLYTTHPDPESAAKRNVFLAQQLCWQAKHELPLIACGDYNALPGSVELAPTAATYRDAWVDAKKAGKATSFTLDGATKAHRIDYVWYRGLTLVSCDVPDTSVAGVFPSDHHPVVTVFA